MSVAFPEGDAAFVPRVGSMVPLTTTAVSTLGGPLRIARLAHGQRPDHPALDLHGDAATDKLDLDEQFQVLAAASDLALEPAHRPLDDLDVIARRQALLGRQGDPSGHQVMHSCQIALKPVLVRDVERVGHEVGVEEVLARVVASVDEEVSRKQRQAGSKGTPLVAPASFVQGEEEGDAMPQGSSCDALLGPGACVQHPPAILVRGWGPAGREQPFGVDERLRGEQRHPTTPWHFLSSGSLAPDNPWSSPKRRGLASVRRPIMSAVPEVFSPWNALCGRVGFGFSRPLDTTIRERIHRFGPLLPEAREGVWLERLYEAEEVGLGARRSRNRRAGSGRARRVSQTTNISRSSGKSVIGSAWSCPASTSFWTT